MNRELRGVLAIFLFALAGCAFGPAGGYDESQDEPPILNAGASPARPEITIAHERMMRPESQPPGMHARVVPPSEAVPLVPEAR